MKSTKRTRYVRYMHIRMASTPAKEFGSLLDLLEILKTAKVELGSGKLLQRKPPTNAREHVRIVDIQISDDERHATFLLRQIDKDQPDAVYEGFDDGALEEHTKGPNQGNRATAHLTVSLHDSKSLGDYQTFRGLLEVVPGIGKQVVEERLCSVGRLCGRAIGSTDGDKTSEPYWAVFEVIPFVERTILQELQTGVLDGFTLVHSEPQNAGFDKKQLVRQEKRKLELKVVAADWRTKLDDVYAAVLGQARNGGYETIKAHYANVDGNPVNVSISAKLEKQEAFEQLVSKTARIDLTEDMHPKQKTVDAEFAKKMIKKLG